MTRRRTRTTHEGRQNAAATPVLLPERLLPARAFFHVTGDTRTARDPVPSRSSINRKNPVRGVIERAAPDLLREKRTEEHRGSMQRRVSLALQLNVSNARAERRGRTR